MYNGYPAQPLSLVPTQNSGAQSCHRRTAQSNSFY